MRARWVLFTSCGPATGGVDGRGGRVGMCPIAMKYRVGMLLTPGKARPAGAGPASSITLTRLPSTLTIRFVLLEQPNAVGQGLEDVDLVSDLVQD
jgi:hypothetical protein